MASIKQIASLLEKSFSKWDFKRAIKLSDNESKTRDYLIEPFFNMLGYTKMEHYSHEYSLRLGKGSVKKIDMVVSLNGRTPIMLVECKKANSNLTHNNFKQLAQYYDNHRESKIGKDYCAGLIVPSGSLRWQLNLSCALAFRFAGRMHYQLFFAVQVSYSFGQLNR